MVLCLVTLTDLQTRRAGLSASAELLVFTAWLQAGCPSCRPNNSVKALKGKIPHPMDLLTPSSPGVFQLCLWPLIAPGYLGEGCLSSALWCQYPRFYFYLFIYIHLFIYFYVFIFYLFIFIFILILIFIYIFIYFYIFKFIFIFIFLFIFINVLIFIYLNINQAWRESLRQTPFIANASPRTSLSNVTHNERVATYSATLSPGTVLWRPPSTRIGTTDYTRDWPELFADGCEGDISPHLICLHFANRGYWLSTRRPFMWFWETCWPIDDMGVVQCPSPFTTIVGVIM